MIDVLRQDGFKGLWKNYFLDLWNILELSLFSLASTTISLHFNYVSAFEDGISYKELFVMYQNHTNVMAVGISRFY